MELQDEYADQGFQVIGIAIDDEEAVKDYADTMGINYPVMAAEIAAMEISRWYGNRINALPYSVFVGRDGIIGHAKPGELTRQQVRMRYPRGYGLGCCLARLSLRALPV